MKKLFALLLVLCMASLASASIVTLADDGLTITATPGETVRLNVTSNTGLLSLDVIGTVTGGDIISGATGQAAAADYGWDPGFSFDPSGLGTASAEIGLGNFNGNYSTVVAYFDILYTGGEQVFSIADGERISRTLDVEYMEPEIYGVVTIVPFSPTCWDANVCAGQPWGDASCDGNVGLADLFALKAHWGYTTPWIYNSCCADFNHDGAVNLGDLFILKANWGRTHFTPSMGNQDCPE